MKITKLIFCTLLLLPTLGLTKTVWVSDEIQAPLRKAPSSRGEIVGFIAAGQPVEKLSEKADDQGTKYTKVKLEDGRIGWLTNYYVLTEKSVHEQISSLKTELTEAKQTISTLESKITSQTNKIEELDSGVTSAQNKLADAVETKTALSDLRSISDNQSGQIGKLKIALEAANNRAEKESLRYANLAKVSQDAVRIDNQNQQLQEKTIKLEQSLQLVESENESLRSRTDKSERFTGAIIISVGIFLGLIIPLFFRRRRSNYR